MSGPAVRSGVASQVLAMSSPGLTSVLCRHGGVVSSSKSSQCEREEKGMRDGDGMRCRQEHVDNARDWQVTWRRVNGEQQEVTDGRTEMRVEGRKAATPLQQE